YYLLFFFSSRILHTRSYGDWSSDVCSSDLASRSVKSPLISCGKVSAFLGLTQVDGGRIIQFAQSPPGTGQIRGTNQNVQIGKLSDRKSTRLNSSHRTISYAVFCLTKKNRHR